MLYISEKINDDLFVVLDTDDNVETKVTLKALTHICSLGVQVLGVVMSPFANKIDSVSVYKPTQSAMRTFTKSIAMQEVSVETRDGEVTAIKLTPGFNRSIAVRLSDYGTKLNMYSVISVPFGATIGEHARVRCIIDSKIKLVKSYSFGNGSTIGNCEIDISEMTDLEMIKRVLSGAITACRNRGKHNGVVSSDCASNVYALVNNMIIATPAQKELIKGIMAIGYDLAAPAPVYDITPWMAAMYKKEFQSIAKAAVELNTSTYYAKGRRQLETWGEILHKDAQFWRSCTLDYDKMLSLCPWLFKVTDNMSLRVRVKAGAVYVIQNYQRYFKLNDSQKQCCAIFGSKLANLLLDMYDSYARIYGV